MQGNDSLIEAFDINGRTTTRDAPNCAAYREDGQGMVRHWARRCIEPGKSRFYDPADDDIRERSSLFACDVFSFRPITDESFRFYIQYLKTKTPLLLRKAERAI